MNKYNKIHFIGIGGIGVSGLAEYFLLTGCKVNGSDINSSHITERLSSLGAVIKIGHSAENIESGTDAVVYSSAVKETNPEMARAHEMGIRTIRRAEMLGEIVNDKYLIAVAGTHGKTTTTAMIGKLLVDAGLDPLIFVGGNVKLFEGGASRFGNGNYAVVEADEYDRSFLTLKPDIAVITNIDEDHLDIYRDLQDIKDTFRQFCENSKQNAHLVFCGDDVNALSTVSDIHREQINYGFHFNNLLKIIDYRASDGQLHYSIANGERTYEGLTLNMAGRHNALNATSGFAAAKILKIDFETYKKSIASFSTVDRRLQLKYEKDGFKVYDDYAHHPKEIESSLKGLREMMTSGKLITVFQPHLFSRTRDFYKDFAQKLASADYILLMDIYPARELPIEGVTSSLIYEELTKLGVNAKYVREKEKILHELSSFVTENNIVVFHGAGDITRVCDEFVNQIKTN